MATLDLVKITKDAWTDISDDMVNGTTYNITPGGTADFIVVEKATEPITADSRFRVSGTELLPVTFEGVAFWCKSLAPSSEVQIQEAP